MSEDTTNLADAPEVDDSLPIDQGQNDHIELDDAGNPITPEPEDDSEEVEHDGQKYKVPKALKDSFLMHRDYTQKTQGLASERQAFEAERTEFRELSAAEVNAHASILAIDNALKDFEQIDWRTWFARDPQAAQAAKLDYDELKDRRQRALGDYGKARETRVLQEQQATAKRMQEGHAELVRDIPGWGQEKATALLSFGQQHFGFSREEMSAISDPRMIKVLNAAFEHTQATAKQKAADKVQAQQAVKPAAKVGGGSTPSGKVDDRTSTDDWMKARNAALSRKR